MYYFFPAGPNPRPHRDLRVIITNIQNQKHLDDVNLNEQHNIHTSMIAVF